MNKKLIVLALVLLIAVGGLFAGDGLPGAGLTANDGSAVTATLKGVIGSSFRHGFKTGDGLYQPTANNDGQDAFTTPPQLIYGYEAKNGVGFTSVMTVSGFKNGSNVVDIASVTITVGDVDTVKNTITDSTEIPVLTYTPSNSLVAAEATIKVTPGSTEGKDVGTYESELSISIVTE